jgi:hypothetical protein
MISTLYRCSLTLLTSLYGTEGAVTAFKDSSARVTVPLRYAHAPAAAFWPPAAVAVSLAAAGPPAPPKQPHAPTNQEHKDLQLSMAPAPCSMLLL